MRKGMPIVLIFLLTLVGCAGNQAGLTNQEAEQVLQQLHDSLQQQNFRFDGSASVERDNLQGEHLVNFTGHINKNQEVYVNVAVPPRKNGMVEDMGFYAKGNDVYMRFADEIAWEKVENRTPFIDEEMNRWNPLHHFQSLMQTPHELQVINGGAPAIKVVLDPTQLRKHYLTDIRSRRDSESQGPEQKWRALTAEGENQDLFMKEINEVKDGIRMGTKDLEDSLAIRGDYIIYYDPEEKIPTKMVYTQEIEFMDDGEQHREITETEIYFREYGEAGSPPDTIGIE